MRAMIMKVLKKEKSFVKKKAIKFKMQLAKGSPRDQKEKEDLKTFQQNRWESGRITKSAIRQNQP